MINITDSFHATGLFHYVKAVSLKTFAPGIFFNYYCIDAAK